MSDAIKHECGIALLRLLKPLSYYQEKYGTPFYGIHKMYLLLEKQHNRGQDGAGIATVKLQMQPGERYIARVRSNDAQPIQDIFKQINQHINDLLEKNPTLKGDVDQLKRLVPYLGEVYLGHVRYGTFGKNSIENVHPFLRENNWNYRNLILAGNFNLTNVNELFNKLVELRSKKGMTPEEAKKLLLNDPNFFGAMLIKMGDADGMVSGSASPTANVLRAAIQIIGTQPGVKTVSSVFIMELSQFKDLFGSILVFGDCSVIPVPTSEQLADIATSAAETAVRIAGINPRVALLTFSTKGSAKHECVDRIIEAGRILRERKVQFRFDDELQADAALVKSVGEIKAPLSDVSGNANVLIFPTLSAGNIGYKLVQRLAGANAYGPIIQGLNSPVNDLSRGCSVEDIVVLTAITSAQACIDC